MAKFDINVKRTYREYDADRPRDVTTEKLHKMESLTKLAIALLIAAVGIVVVLLILRAFA